MKLSVVIPCYNEQEVILETQSRLVFLLNEFLNKKIISDYEILYIDDGSQDQTFQHLEGIAAEDQHAKVIALSNNFGHQAALTAGLLHASGDAVVSMDADLQDPPDVITVMLTKFQQGFDIVYGVRSDRKKDSLFKKLTAVGFYKLMEKMGVPLIYNHGDFRLISRKVLDAFKQYGEVNRFIRGMFPHMGFKSCTVQYSREKRFAGETKYPLIKMLAFAFEGITSFSHFPLRLASFMGGGVCAVTLVIIGWAIFVKLTGQDVPGWTSTVLPIYFLGGVQLLVLGVIGEYIGKIYMEIKKRPLFIIHKKINL